MKGTVFQIHKLMERNNHFGLLELGSTFCGRRFPIPNLWGSLYCDRMTQDFLGPTQNQLASLLDFVPLLYLFPLVLKIFGFLTKNHSWPRLKLGHIHKYSWHCMFLIDFLFHIHSQEMDNPGWFGMTGRHNSHFYPKV